MADVTLDRRTGVDKKVFRTPKQALDFLSTDTVKSFTLDCNGLMHTIVLVAPPFQNAATVILTITDSDGFEIFNSGSKARGTTHVITNTTSLIPLCGLVTVTLTLSEAAGTDGTAYVAFYFV